MDATGKARKFAVTVDVELDGTRRRVTMRRSADTWVAEIDGREMEVSFVEGSMLVGPAAVRKSYEIAFDPRTTGELIVHVNGVAVSVTVLDRRRRRRGADETDARPQAIVAPMPGRIVKVLVKPDETVAARQPLVVVEAMKMENELRAPRAGVVADVRVAEGASVEANTVLVVLK